jgi:hypothetical protein
LEPGLNGDQPKHVGYLAPLYAVHGERVGGYLNDEGGLLRPTPNNIHPGQPDRLVLCGPPIDRALLADWIRCEWALGDVLTPYIARATREALDADQIQFASDGSLKLKKDRHDKMPISPAKRHLEHYGKAVDTVLQAPASAMQKMLPPKKKGHAQRPLGSSVTAANRKGHQADFMAWSPDQAAKAVAAPLHEQPVGDGYGDMFNLPLSMYNAANIYKNRQMAADKVYSAKLEVVLNFRGYMDFLTKLALNEEDPTAAEAEAFGRCREALCNWTDTAGIIAEYAKRKAAELEGGDDIRLSHAHSADANRHVFRSLDTGIAKDVVVAPASGTANFAKGVAYTAGAASDVTSSLATVAGVGSVAVGGFEAYQALAERAAATADIARCKRAIAALEALIVGNVFKDITSCSIARACQGFFKAQLKLAKKNKQFATGRGVNGVVRAGGGAASTLLLPISMTGVLGATAAASAIPVLGTVPAVGLSAYYGTMFYKLHVVRHAAHRQKRDQQDGASMLLNTPEIEALEDAFRTGFEVTYGAGTPIGGERAFAGEHEKTYAEESCVSLAVELIANSFLDGAQRPYTKGTRKSDDVVAILQAFGFDPLQRIQLGIRLGELLDDEKTRGEALKLIKDTLSRCTGIPTIRAEHAHIGMYRQGFEDSLEHLDLSFHDADTRALREAFGERCHLDDFAQAAQVSRAAVLDPTHRIQLDGPLIEMLTFDADMAVLASKGPAAGEQLTLYRMWRDHWEGRPRLDAHDPLYARYNQVRKFLANHKLDLLANLGEPPVGKKARQARDDLKENLTLLLCSRGLSWGQRETLKLLRDRLRDDNRRLVQLTDSGEEGSV